MPSSAKAMHICRRIEYQSIMDTRLWSKDITCSRDLDE